MVAIRYEILDRPRTGLAPDIQHIGKIIPLINEYWESQGKAYYGDYPFGLSEDMAIINFVKAWQNGSVVLIAAFENDQPVGFLIALRIVPLLRATGVLQVDSYYGKTPEALAGLFAFFRSVLPVYSPDELIVPILPELPSGCLDGIMPKQKELKFFRGER